MIVPSVDEVVRAHIDLYRASLNDDQNKLLDRIIADSPYKSLDNASFQDLVSYYNLIRRTLNKE